MSAPWEWITPLGSLVDPEVWTITMRSAGVTAASAAASTSSPTPAAPPSSPAMVQPGWTPGSASSRSSAMRRSEGAASENRGGGAGEVEPSEAGHQARPGSPGTGTGARSGASRCRRGAGVRTARPLVEKVLNGTLTAPIRAAASQATTNSGAVGVQQADAGAQARPGGRAGPGRARPTVLGLGVGERLVVQASSTWSGTLGRLRREQRRRRSAAGRHRRRSRPRSRWARRGETAGSAERVARDRHRPRPRTARVRRRAARRWTRIRPSETVRSRLKEARQQRGRAAVAQRRARSSCRPRPRRSCGAARRSRRTRRGTRRARSRAGPRRRRGMSPCPVARSPSTWMSYSGKHGL